MKFQGVVDRESRLHDFLHGFGAFRRPFHGDHTQHPSGTAERFKTLTLVFS